MARILYGVCGEGLGHSSRSETVSSILASHEIVFAASQKAYDHLSGLGKQVIRIQGLGFALKDNRVDVLQTLGKNLKGLEALASVRKLVDFCKEWRPQLVLTDFEPFTAVAAKLLGIPLLSIDHQKVIDRTRIEYPKSYMGDYLGASIVTANMVPFADRFIISSFFFPEPKSKDTVLVGPLIRQEVLDAKPGAGRHVLVYQSYDLTEQMTAVLRQVPREQFIVYGKRAGRRGNLVFRRLSREGFIRDLASAKAVVTNGGYTLMSEALQLRKPVLSMPVPGQFEQVLNAYYLEKLGYGKYYDELDEVKVIGFLHNLDKYRKALQRRKGPGNKMLHKELKTYLKN